MGDDSGATKSIARPRLAPVAPYHLNTITLFALPCLRLCLEDADGKALAGASYTIEWRGAPPHTAVAKTDGDGVLNEPIPMGASVAVLTISPATAKAGAAGWKMTVVVGDVVGPQDTKSGLAARLSNLGYLPLPGTPPTLYPDPRIWSPLHAADLDLAAMVYFWTSHDRAADTASEMYQAVFADHDGA